MKNKILIFMLIIILIPIILEAGNFFMGRRMSLRKVNGLPSTGYSEGILIYNEQNHKSYISTTTVTNVLDWVALN